MFLSSWCPWIPFSDINLISSLIHLDWSTPRYFLYWKLTKPAFFPVTPRFKMNLVIILRRRKCTIVRQYTPCYDLSPKNTSIKPLNNVRAFCRIYFFCWNSSPKHYFYMTNKQGKLFNVTTNNLFLWQVKWFTRIAVIDNGRILQQVRPHPVTSPLQEYLCNRRLDLVAFVGRTLLGSLEMLLISC